MKKGKVWIDGESVLCFAKKNLGTGRMFTSLDTRQLLLDYQYCANSTPSIESDDYCHVGFPVIDLRFEMPAKYGVKKLLILLLKEGVLDQNGSFSEEKAREFYRKYDIEAPLSVTKAAKKRREERRKLRNMQK